MGKHLCFRDQGGEHWGMAEETMKCLFSFIFLCVYPTAFGIIGTSLKRRTKSAKSK